MFRLGYKCPNAIEQKGDDMKDVGLVAESSGGASVRYLARNDDMRNKNIPYHFETIALPDRMPTPERGLRLADEAERSNISAQANHWYNIQEDLSNIAAFFIREDIATWQSGVQYMNSFLDRINMPLYSSQVYNNGTNERCKFMI